MEAQQNDQHQVEYERLFSTKKNNSKKWLFLLLLILIIAAAVFIYTKSTDESGSFLSKEDNAVTDSLQEYFLPEKSFNSVTLRFLVPTPKLMLTSIYTNENHYTIIYETSTELNSKITEQEVMKDVDFYYMWRKYIVKKNEVQQYEEHQVNNVSNEIWHDTFATPRIILKIPPLNGKIEWVENFSTFYDPAKHPFTSRSNLDANIDDSKGEIKWSISDIAEWDTVLIKGEIQKCIKVTRAKKTISPMGQEMNEGSEKDYYIYGIGLGKIERRLPEDPENKFVTTYLYENRYYHNYNADLKHWGF